MNQDRIQRGHYEQIGDAYSAHYDDPSSLAYRERFIYGPLFGGMRLGGLRVLEAMCGAGSLTGFLLGRGARVTGLDLSERQMRAFSERWPDCEALCGSIFETGIPPESFDCVAVVGGLHHVQPHIGKAVREIHRLLRPGGTLCFAEPHRGSLPDLVRRFWYRHDPLFMENEESVDAEALMREFGALFEFAETRYAGNLAYLFVLNSMVFRIPLPLKRFYTPSLMAMEAALRPLQGKATACMVLARWVKK